MRFSLILGRGVYEFQFIKGTGNGKGSYEEIC